MPTDSMFVVSGANGTVWVKVRVRVRVRVTILWCEWYDMHSGMSITPAPTVALTPMPLMR